jgi:hypothetical protein
VERGEGCTMEQVPKISETQHYRYENFMSEHKKAANSNRKTYSVKDSNNNGKGEQKFLTGDTKMNSKHVSGTSVWI